MKNLTVTKFFLTLVMLAALIFQRQIGYTRSLILAGIVIAYFIIEGILRTRKGNQSTKK
ncbi:hypothetical protein [Brochothrix campestris]|uniref:hypothetical protein n=1 Tax=Brochothrix campestris TaxID=2757 RepID=UPI0004B790FA|nr:hypothetical protein [Brochothrix campestris]